MKPARFRQPPRKRKRSPEVASATQAHQDSLSLARTLLDTWAWHPACPLHRAREGPPVDFGWDDATSAEVRERYKRVFQPFVLDETVAQLQREADEEIVARRVLKVQLTRILDLRNGKADVTARLDARQVFDDSLKRKLRDGALVLLCPKDPVATMPQGVTAALQPPRADLPANADDIAARALPAGNAPDDSAEAAAAPVAAGGRAHGGGCGRARLW